jgi:hypothetical protein
MKFMNYKDKLWKIFSLYIRLRDSDEYGYCHCISCGAKKYFKEVDAGHFIPKTRGNSIYFDENNVNAQCPYCNRYLHGNLYWYGKNLEDKIGKDEVDKLFLRAKEIRKIRPKEYEELIAYYKLQVKNYCDVRNLSL